MRILQLSDTHLRGDNSLSFGVVDTRRCLDEAVAHLKSLAQDESRELGEKLLAQALRAEGLGQPLGQQTADKPLWDKLLRFTGNRTREEMMTDIGLGKRSANMVAKRLVTLLAAEGVKPDALLLTHARYTAHENLSQGAMILDGAPNTTVKYATCCRPIPGDGVLGYLGRGEGLVVHTDECAVARRLQHKDAERFITVPVGEPGVKTGGAAIGARGE